MTAIREKLPMRRPGRTLVFAFPKVPADFSREYAVQYSCFGDGRAAEVFLTLYGRGAVGSALEAVCRDASICASLLLQMGLALDEVIESLTSSGDGKAVTVIGEALRLVRDDLAAPEDLTVSPDQPGGVPGCSSGDACSVREAAVSGVADLPDAACAGGL